MARRVSAAALFAVMVVATALTTGAHGAGTCDSQTLDTSFDNCIDLPQQGSFLHYTYDPANTSISIAFIAKPSTSSGWVAWGINPTGPGMLGTQAFVAFLSGGAVSVNTYNVAGYSPSAIVPVPLSFATWDVRAQKYGSSGEYVIYAKAKVPVGSQKSLTHLWQVGPSVNGSVLAQHAMLAENTKSVGAIDLTQATVASAPSPGGSAIPAASPAASPSGSAIPVASPAASPSGDDASSPTPAASPSGGRAPSATPTASPAASSGDGESSGGPISGPVSSRVSGGNASAPAPSSGGRFRLGIGCVFSVVVVVFSFLFF